MTQIVPVKILREAVKFFQGIETELKANDISCITVYFYTYRHLHHPITSALSVSYTHLDVYKRQHRTCSCSGLRIFFLVSSTRPRGVISTSTVFTGSAVTARRSAARSVFRLSSSFISIKSTIMIPERFLRRCWTAISPAASRFVFRYVSSDVFFEILLAVFTSMTVSASVGSVSYTHLPSVGIPWSYRSRGNAHLSTFWN